MGYINNVKMIGKEKKGKIKTNNKKERRKKKKKLTVLRREVMQKF